MSKPDIQGLKDRVEALFDLMQLFSYNGDQELDQQPFWHIEGLYNGFKHEHLNPLVERFDKLPTNVVYSTDWTDFESDLAYANSILDGYLDSVSKFVDSSILDQLWEKIRQLYWTYQRRVKVVGQELPELRRPILDAHDHYGLVRDHYRRGLNGVLTLLYITKAKQRLEG